MFKKIFSLSLILISTCSHSSPGSFTPFAKLSSVIIEGSDEAPVATIRFEGGIDSSYKNEACQSEHITVDISSEKGKSMYSMILSARMAGKEIRVTLPFCSGNRPLVNSVSL